MFKLTLAAAAAVAVTGNPFVGENQNKMHVDHGDGRWSTKLKPGAHKMRQFKHDHKVNRKQSKTMY